MAAFAGISPSLKFGLSYPILVTPLAGIPDSQKGIYRASSKAVKKSVTSALKYRALAKGYNGVLVGASTVVGGEK